MEFDKLLKLVVEKGASDLFITGDVVNLGRSPKHWRTMDTLMVSGQGRPRRR